MKKITIPYFPTGIKYATPLLPVMGIYLWTLGYPVWIGILTFLAIIILTTHYETVINLDKKEFRDFLSILWMPLQEEKIKFNKIEKIVISKENHSQVLNSRTQSRQLDWASFTGTLITDEGKTLDLLTRTDKSELIAGLKEFASFLNVAVEDQTTSEHFRIDISRY